MTPEMARAQIKRLHEQWDRNAGDRRRARQLSRMAHGDWADSIPKMPAEPDWHATKDKRPPYAPNLLGLALRQLSYLYDEEPRRDMAVESEQDWASESLHEFGIGLSASMSAADTMARLHGASLLILAYKHSPFAARDTRAVLMGDEPSPSADYPDGVEAVPVARHQFEVLANELDHRYIEAGIVLIGKKGDKPVHHYWDRHYFARLVDFAPVEIGPEDSPFFIEHGIGDHPLVLIRNDEISTETIPHGLGGMDIVDNMLAIGSQWREYGWTAKLQRGQPYAVGKMEKGTLSPESVIQIEDGGQFGIIANGANLAGMKDSVLVHMEILAKTLGLPSRTFRLADSASMSGVAIALDRAELEDDRRTRVKSARHWERSTHIKAALVYNAARKTGISGRVTVEFRPLPQLVTFADRLARVTFLREQRLISDLDTLREMYPDTPDSELQARLDRANEENQEKAEEQAMGLADDAGMDNAHPDE